MKKMERAIHEEGLNTFGSSVACAAGLYAMGKLVLPAAFTVALATSSYIVDEQRPAASDMRKAAAVYALGAAVCDVSKRLNDICNDGE